MQSFKSGRGEQERGSDSTALVRSLLINCIPIKLLKIKSFSCSCGNVRALSGFTRNTGAVSSSYLWHAWFALMVTVLLDQDIVNLRVLKYTGCGQLKILDTT